MEEFRPFNRIESAAVRCDIERLKREIEKVRAEQIDFNISDHVRINFVTLQMFQNTQAASKENAIMETLTFLASQGFDFSSEVVLGASGITSLMYAAKFSARICQRLVDLGAKLNAVNRNGRTALFYAALSKVEALQIVQVLLDAGIDYGINFHFIAEMAGVSEQPVLELLIDRYVDAESESQSGEIALCVVSSHGNWNRKIEVVEHMMGSIEYSIKVKVKIYEYLGCSCSFKWPNPMESRCWEYWKKAVQLRHEHQITPKGLPSYDPGQFDLLALQNDRLKIVSLLFCVIEGYYQQHKRNNLKYISLNLHKLYRLSSADFSVENCKDWARIIQFLLNHHSDVCSRSGTSAVWLYVDVLVCSIHKLSNVATGIGKPATEKLIAQLIKLNRLDEYGRTVLHQALLRQGPRIGSRFEVVEAMLKFGADPRARDEEGYTPFQVYLDNKSSDVKFLELFMEHGAVHIDERYGEGKRVHEHLRSLEIPGFHELNYVDLRCLTARAIVHHGIEYVGVLPKKLHKFIEIHK